MNNLFIVKDYETGEPLSYYLTNNVYECKAIMEMIDRAQDEDENDEFYSPSIVAMKDNGFDFVFQELVKEHDWLQVELITTIDTYEY